MPNDRITSQNNKEKDLRSSKAKANTRKSQTHKNCQRMCKRTIWWIKLEAQSNWLTMKVTHTIKSEMVKADMNVYKLPIIMRQ